MDDELQAVVDRQDDELNELRQQIEEVTTERDKYADMIAEALFDLNSALTTLNR